MDGFQTQVVIRLPLAEAMYRVLGHVLSPDMLASLYDLYRGHGYEEAISFRAMVWLVHDALFVHASARQAIEKARESGELSANNSSVYQKLGRLNISLSTALVRHTAVPLEELLAKAGRTPALPVSLDCFDPIVIDGKTLKHVSHRLKAARPYRGKATSGKLLAGLSMRGELVRAIEATPDSYTNDVPLVPGLLAQLQGRDGLPMLFIADRQFGGVRVPLELCQGGNHFLIRFQANVRFHVDRSRPASQGTDQRGRHYTEDWGWIGSGQRLYGRRIVLKRPGLDDVIVQTDLVDAKAYPAEDLLTAYDERWTIERVFQQLTEVYNLRHLIGSRPQATIFQAALCLLMYNVLQVIKSHVAAGGPLPPRKVSSELVFDDAAAQLTTWNTLLSPEFTVEAVSAPMGAGSLRDYLGRKLRPLWTPRWLKAPKKKPTPYQKKLRPPDGSICVHRKLEAEKRRTQRSRNQTIRANRNIRGPT